MQKITKTVHHIFKDTPVSTDYLYVTDAPTHSPFQSSLTGQFIEDDCKYSLISKNPLGKIDMQKIYLGTFKSFDEEVENELYYLIYDKNNFSSKSSIILAAREGFRPDLHIASFYSFNKPDIEISLMLGPWSVDFIGIVQFYFFNPKQKSGATSFTDFVQNHSTFITSNISG